MNANKRLEMNHVQNTTSSSLGHMATLPKNMTFCNNIAGTGESLVTIRINHLRLHWFNLNLFENYFFL